MANQLIALAPHGSSHTLIGMVIDPTICVLQSGGSYPWFQDPDSQ